MAKIPFLERIAQGKPLLADGAMGTMLHQRGAQMTTCFDQLNISQPERVARIHSAFIDAGAELIETNTFSANRFKLAEYGLEDQLAAINAAGVTLARRVVEASFRDDVYIAGALGPLGVRLKPYGRIKPEEARAVFAEQIAALAAAGPDLLILETFTDLAEILEALAAAREAAPGLPVVAQMTFAQDDRTLLGHLPGRVARDLRAAGADIIGVNCAGGPAQITRILQAMRAAAPDARLSAMPNAGFPESVGGRLMYPATADYFADFALTFQAAGACVVGGCCGTTPDHISAMRRALDDPTRSLPVVPMIEISGVEEEFIPERPTELADKLARGHFLISVEMAPPRAYTPQRLLTAAQLLQSAGADVINVADSPTARMRMSPWAICHLLQTRLGMETILHFPTRGRNLLRVQGDLLAAHALGLRNLFVVMGDPTKIGDYPEAMDNYDVAPSSLIGLIKHRMNKGVDQAGNSIGQPTAFTVGCALNICANDTDHEIKVLLKKLENGADFALGQAVFEPERIEQFHKRYREITGEDFTLPVLMAVMPLFSARHAAYLHNEVPGIIIPDAIMARIEAAGDDAPAVGVEIARELLLKIKPMVQGAYIIPAFGHYDLAAEVVDSVAVQPAR